MKLSNNKLTKNKTKKGVYLEDPMEAIQSRDDFYNSKRKDPSELLTKVSLKSPHLRLNYSKRSKQATTVQGKLIEVLDSTARCQYSVYPLFKAKIETLRSK